MTNRLPITAAVAPDVSMHALPVPFMNPTKLTGAVAFHISLSNFARKYPREYHAAIGQWMYGCDICQDVCPWNRKAAPGTEERLRADPEITMKETHFWEELT